LRRRPKTAELKEESRKRFGSEFHVDEPATANARPWSADVAALMAGSRTKVLSWCSLWDWWPVYQQILWSSAIGTSTSN